MNAGEAIVFEPVSFEIPSAIPADVWRDTLFDHPEPGERLGFRLLHRPARGVSPLRPAFHGAGDRSVPRSGNRSCSGSCTNVTLPGWPPTDAVSSWRTAGSCRRGVRKRRPCGGGWSASPSISRAISSRQSSVTTKEYSGSCTTPSPSSTSRASASRSASGVRSGSSGSNFWRLYDVTAANVGFRPGPALAPGIPGADSTALAGSNR